jgi:hypothetical protein
MCLLTLRYLKLTDKYQAPGVEAAVLAQLQNRPKQDMPSILALGLIYGSVETVRHALKHFDGGWKIPPDTQRVKPVFYRPCRTLTTSRRTSICASHARCGSACSPTSRLCSTKTRPPRATAGASSRPSSRRCVAGARAAIEWPADPSLPQDPDFLLQLEAPFEPPASEAKVSRSTAPPAAPAT